MQNQGSAYVKYMRNIGESFYFNVERKDGRK